MNQASRPVPANESVTAYHLMMDHIDRRGFIREGYHADLALVDLSHQEEISNENELSKCGWTPYDGLTTHSKVTHTFVNGSLVYERGVFHEECRGERLLFN